jgi:hypothetical protein
MRKLDVHKPCGVTVFVSDDGRRPIVSPPEVTPDKVPGTTILLYGAAGHLQALCQYTPRLSGQDFRAELWYGC